MIFGVENTQNYYRAGVPSLPLVLSVNRERVEDIQSAKARMLKMMVFAFAFGLVIMTSLALFFIATNTTEVLIILGIAALIGIADIFVVKTLKKTHQRSSGALAADGSTVIVVDQAGIRVGDTTFPRDRITCVFAHENAGSTQTQQGLGGSLINVMIGLDQVSTMQLPNVKLTRTSGSGTDTGYYVFNFDHYLKRAELDTFLAGAEQVSARSFPVAKATDAIQWAKAQRAPGSSRVEIWNTAEELATAQ